MNGSRFAAAMGLAALLTATPVGGQTETPSAQRITDANALKAEADARKAAWDARAAESEAKNKAFEAATKSIAGLNPAKGETKVEGDGGKIEAEMLAAKAVQAAAKKIADAVKDKGPFFLVAGDEPFSTDNWSIFQAQAIGVDMALKAQGCPVLPAKPPQDTQESAESGALQIIGLAAQLLKSDLTITGFAMTPDQALLLREVAKWLSTGMGANIPSAAFGIDIAGSTPISTINELDKLHGCVLGKIKALSVEPKPKPKVPDPKREAELAALKEGSARYTGFLARLTTPDSNGKIELVEVVRQSGFATPITKTDIITQTATIAAGRPPEVTTIETKTISPAKVLRVNVHKVGGSLLTRKNLWTIFGLGKPLEVSSGVVVSYQLTDKFGKVLASGSMACASGFYSVSSVQRGNPALGPAATSCSVQ
jgi:hypothetical protein